MAVVLLANVFLGVGGKCPNLGVVNVRILGVVNVRLANNLTPNLNRNQVKQIIKLFSVESKNNTPQLT